MRGNTSHRGTMLRVIDPEQLISANHPIRRIRLLVVAALVDLGPTFERMYAEIGRPSIPLEHLLKRCLLVALYSIRSARLRSILLFKWFLDLNVGDEPFDHSSFAKDRRRLLDHQVSREFFEALMQQSRRGRQHSSQHFTVDGTQPESWASMKSLLPRQGDGAWAHSGGGGKNADVDFRGQRRDHEMHYSTTDPRAQMARMARKGLGKETRLCFIGHVPMDNRHGLAVDVEVTQATGTRERAAAIALLQRRGVRRRRCTLAEDKGYDTRDLVDRCRAMSVSPHIAMHKSWCSPGTSRPAHAPVWTCPVLADTFTKRIVPPGSGGSQRQPG